jgi:hypothetical protein
MPFSTIQAGYPAELGFHHGIKLSMNLRDCENFHLSYRNRSRFVKEQSRYFMSYLPFYALSNIKKRAQRSRHLKSLKNIYRTISDDNPQIYEKSNERTK